MILCGIDLAWKSQKNTSGMALGDLQGNQLTLTDLYSAVGDITEVLKLIVEKKEVIGITIDAPLIITNQSGQRLCEKQIGQTYGKKHASCHTSNLKLYPGASSVKLSAQLQAFGYHHLTHNSLWQIECYPHPAIIEIFDLDMRLAYKKGRSAEKKEGQKKLASYIQSLQNSAVLELNIPSKFQNYFDPQYIDSLFGVAFKQNEDCLDAIICLYIAGLFAISVKGRVFGDRDNGYIYVPQVMC